VAVVEEVCRVLRVFRHRFEARERGEVAAEVDERCGDQVIIYKVSENWVKVNLDRSVAIAGCGKFGLFSFSQNGTSIEAKNLLLRRSIRQFSRRTTS
jgi:hypothetical protein